MLTTSPQTTSSATKKQLLSVIHLSNAVYMPMGGESVLMRQERWVTLFSHARIAVQQLLICSLSQRQNQNL